MVGAVQTAITPSAATPTATTQTPTATTPWARVFAILYEPFLWVGERAGLRTLRADQLSRAYGRTVEIGSGTGLNLPHYPHTLDELVLVEPDGAMRSRLERRLSHGGLPQARVVDGSAEQLPFADGTIDTVVSTLVLCTVDSPDIALHEIARVLRPGGQLLYIEHVRSESPTLARWQDLLAAPWRRFARGCHSNRATGELIAASGLVPGPVRHAAWHGMPPIVRPLIIGQAHSPR